MSAIFLKLIEQLNSSVFVLIVILIIAFWATYKLGWIINLFKSFKERNKETGNDIKSIGRTLSAVKATTDLLYKAHLNTIKAHSPISLTEKGNTMSSDLKLEDKVTAHWNDIKNKIEEKEPSNPYDIQVISMDIANGCFEQLFSELEKNEIKVYAYNKGEDLLQIFPIIGVIIRDRYLKEKGIPASEIDTHTPKQ